jgi:hypothetical protein
MNTGSLLHYVPLLLPFVGALVLLAGAALAFFYPRPPDTLDHVAMFVRQLDALDLAALLDPSVSLALRKSLSGQAYRRELDVHIRLVREYFSRVNHNVHVLHDWILGEYAPMAGKDAGEYTARERLVVEALQTAKLLKRSMLAVNFTLWIWGVVRIDRWPVRFLPNISNLRVQYGVNVLVNYGRLANLTRALCLEHCSWQELDFLEAL